MVMCMFLSFTSGFGEKVCKEVGILVSFAPPTIGKHVNTMLFCNKTDGALNNEMHNGPSSPSRLPGPRGRGLRLITWLLPVQVKGVKRQR